MGTAAADVTALVKNLPQVPLQFWFCRNPGLALPLIALQYHEVKLKLTFPEKSEIATGTVASASPSLSSVEVWADYIYLDTDERRRFAQVSHEYLIEQLQYQSESKGSTFTLNFNHPVKDLYGQVLVALLPLSMVVPLPQLALSLMMALN